MPRGREARTVLVALAVVMMAAVVAHAHDAASDGERRSDDGRRTVDQSETAYTYAIGAFRPEYTPPAPGTYTLPPIATVSDHALLDEKARPTNLFDVVGDRVTIVAFVYTTCTEAGGCPVSFAVLHGLDRALAADRDLARRVRLVTISFDPERDTPARMAATRRLHRPRGDWRFLTTRDEAALAPVLADFDQPIAKLRYDDGTWTGLFRHVLKVFLVDPQHRVRNVYSTGFFNPALVLNDVKTVLLGANG